MNKREKYTLKQRKGIIDSEDLIASLTDWATMGKSGEMVITVENFKKKSFHFNPKTTVEDIHDFLNKTQFGMMIEVTIRDKNSNFHKASYHTLGGIKNLWIEFEFVSELTVN